MRRYNGAGFTVTAIAMLITLLSYGAWAAESVTIRFLTNETDPPSLAMYREAIAEFEATTGIKVKLETTTSSEARIQQLINAGTAGVAPDVYKLEGEDLYRFAKAGLLEPLDELVADIGIENYKPEALRPATIDNRIWALPYTGSKYSTLWYRKDIFAQAGLNPPTTWDELLSVSAKLSNAFRNSRTQMYPLAIPGGRNKFLNLIGLQYLWQNGQTLYDENLRPNIDTERTVETLEFFKKLSQYTPPGFPSYSYFETIDAFVAQQTAMLYYSGRGLGRVYENAPQLLDVVDAVRVPKGPVTDAFYEVWGFYGVASRKAGGKNIEAAKQFLKYLLTGERLAKFALTVPGHLIPALNPILDDPAFWQGHPLLSSHRSAMELLYYAEGGLDYITEAGAKVVDGHMQRTGVINPAAGGLVTDLVIATGFQMVALQGRSPREAIDWMNTALERLTREFAP